MEQFFAILQKGLDQLQRTFRCNVENGYVEGYNALFEEDRISDNLAEVTELIYKEAPEWVLEVGEETMIADLCRSFTTVVTRGCVKTIPVMNAPIIALASDYTKEERAEYAGWLKTYQQFVEVKHSIVEKEEILAVDGKESYCR